MGRNRIVWVNSISSDEGCRAEVVDRYGNVLAVFDSEHDARSWAEEAGYTFKGYRIVRR